MRLEGSCHCGNVRFSLDSQQPWPYQRCYCSICRKTGSGGFMINLGGDHRTMVIEGEEHLQVYQSMIDDDDAPGGRRKSRHKRFFCRACGSHLWAYNDRWPELVHPVASAIDTPLPAAPAHSHMMVGSKASWVPLEKGPDDEVFDEYPRASLASWHQEQGYSD